MTAHVTRPFDQSFVDECYKNNVAKMFVHEGVKVEVVLLVSILNIMDIDAIKCVQPNVIRLSAGCWIKPDQIERIAELFPHLEHLTCPMEDSKEKQKPWSEIFAPLSKLTELHCYWKTYKNIDNALRVNDGRDVKITKLVISLEGTESKLSPTNLFAQLEHLREYTKLHIKLHAKFSVENIIKIQGSVGVAVCSLCCVDDFSFSFKDDTFTKTVEEASKLTLNNIFGEHRVASSVYNGECLFNRFFKDSILQNQKRMTTLLSLLNL